MTARLPMELLVAVLRQLHALTDVIKARQVCRRWRAAVEIVAAHDRAFAYQCGLPDWLAIRNLRGFPDPAISLADISGFPGARYGDVWCTCGRVLPDLISAAMLASKHRPLPHDRPPYQGRHGSTAAAPPARWEQLRPSRDLALELAQACARIDSRVPTDATGGFPQAPWLPVFRWMPESVVRPKTPDELLALVRFLVHDVEEFEGEPESLWSLLSNPEHACRWYAAQVEELTESRTVALSRSWEARWRATSPPAPAAAAPARRGQGGALRWWPQFQKDFPDFKVSTRASLLVDDPGSWQLRRFMARRLALEWNCAVQSNLVRDYLKARNLQPVDDKSAYARTSYLYEQVAALDAAAALFAERCVLSCTHANTDLPEYELPPSWATTYFIGLDAHGNLVGAFTTSEVPAYDL